MTKPAISYDDGVFRNGLLRRAKRQFGHVTVRDVIDSFWEAGPEIREALLNHGGPEMIAKAERRLREHTLPQLQWQLDEIGVKMSPGEVE